MEAYRSVLDALAAPTRRALVEELARGPRSVADLAAGLPISRPAVSQHLKALQEAGVVSHVVAGRRHLYRVEPGALAALHAYVERFWKSALESYERDHDDG